MKHVTIIGGGLLALALGVIGVPAGALTLCDSEVSGACSDTFCSCNHGNTLSSHGCRLISLDGTIKDKRVIVDLIGLNGSPAKATSIGVDVNNTATGVGCTVVDTNPNRATSEQRSGFGKCNGTDHPLARVIGALFS